MAASLRERRSDQACGFSGVVVIVYVSAEGAVAADASPAVGDGRSPLRGRPCSSHCEVTTQRGNVRRDASMLKRDMTRWRMLFAAILVAMALIGPAPSGSEYAMAAGGACTLVPSERDPAEKILQCGDELTVRPAQGASYRLIYKRGRRLPSAIRLNNGALLIEFHPDSQQIEFQILTPLAIAAVRGTKWAMEVSTTRTSTLVLEGAVAVTSRRLNQYVVLTEGQGVDISEGDTSLTPKQWGEARVRALLQRFGE
jgi:ferric-dicitrate binding protein FerR (iron transport regulator)